MAWTELHDTLPDHPKTKLLMTALGSTKAHAVGLLCSLWCFTMRFGKEGTISETYWRAFCADMGETDPDATLAALTQSKWVRNGNGNVTCHDWDDYAGRLEDYRKANRERQRRYRAKMRAGSEGDKAETGSTGESKKDNAHVTRDVTRQTRESHTTQPNPTVQNSTNKTKKPARKRARFDPDSVEIPDSLKDHEAALRDWFRYKQERGESYKPTGLKAFFTKCGNKGSMLTEAINHSMANNYMGIYDPPQARQEHARKTAVSTKYQRGEDSDAYGDA